MNRMAQRAAKEIAKQGRLNGVPLVVIEEVASRTLEWIETFWAMRDMVNTPDLLGDDWEACGACGEFAPLDELRHDDDVDWICDECASEAETQAAMDAAGSDNPDDEAREAQEALEAEAYSHARACANATPEPTPES